MSDPHDLKKAVCPSCVSEMLVDVLHEETTSWTDNEVPIWGADRYWIIKCRGCDRIFFGQGTTFSEDTEDKYFVETGEWAQVIEERRTFFPRTSKRRRPEWLNFQFEMSNSQLALILHEIYSSIDHEIVRLAASGIRMAFDSISINLGVDDSLTFAEKLESMRKRQHITGRERDYLQVLIDAGSAAAHRGWRPTSSELSTLIEILEGTIHRALVLPTKVADLQSAIPKKGGQKVEGSESIEF